MKNQATKMTPHQLHYIKHWSKRGYKYRPGDEVPEDVSIRPPALDKAGQKEVIFGLVLLALIIAAATSGNL